MFQLKWDDKFAKEVRDIPYWQTKEDIPKHIQKYIQNISEKRVIYNQSTNHFYCSKCINELNQDNYCFFCQIQYPRFDKKNDTSDFQIIYDESFAIKDLFFSFNYYVFDIVDNFVYLYLITEAITYYNPLVLMPYKISKLNIDKAYLIEKEGLTDLKTNKFISFAFLAQFKQNFEDDAEDFWDNLNDKEFALFEFLVLDNPDSYVYTANLTQLKNTIYKYSKIWNLKEVLNKHEPRSIASLTFYPLYYPQFEYLVNYKLYNLALTNPDYFKNGHNFLEIFGLEKSYLPFMSQHNLDFKEYQLLQLSKIADMATLNFFSKFDNYFYPQFKTLVLKDKINLTTLKDYLLKIDSPNYFQEYLDYINMARELKLDLNNKKVLYPQDLRKAHDELYNALEIVIDPVIDQKIKVLAFFLALNNYEDENYLIFPASSTASLVLESKQQKNCVRMYAPRIVSNECQIYFMRQKSNPNKSFVTIEVADNRIVQARIKYNRLPPEEVNEILKKWEKNLIPLVIQN